MEKEMEKKRIFLWWLWQENNNAKDKKILKFEGEILNGKIWNWKIWIEKHIIKIEFYNVK